MVRLFSLQARNFKKLRFNSPVHFSNGITLISGLNESGKSSVLDAILYALFGHVTRPRNARNEDLVAYGANEAALILDFEVENRSFRVTRTLHKLRPTRALLEELRTEKPPQLVAKGQEKTNEEIVRLLGGITYQEIVSSTVVAQKELSKLIELNKEDRKRVVNAFLNLESFNTVLANLTDERRDLEGTGSRPGSVKSEREKLQLLQRELQQYQQNTQDKENLQQENSSLTATISDLQRKFQDKNGLYNDLGRYEDALKTKESLTIQLSERKKLQDDYRERAERLNHETEAVQQELTKFIALDTMEPLLSKLSDQLSIAKTQEAELIATKHHLDTAQNGVAEVEQTLKPVGELQLRHEAVQLNKPIRPFVLLSVLLFMGCFVALLVGLLPAAVLLGLAGAAVLMIAGRRIQVAASIAKDHVMLGDLKYLDSRRGDLVRVQQEYAQARQSYDLANEQLVVLCDSLRVQGELFNSTNGMGTLEAARTILELSRKDMQARDALQIKLQTLNEEVGKLPSQGSVDALDNEIKDMGLQLSSVVFPTLPQGMVFDPKLLSETLSARDELSRQIATTEGIVHQNLRRIMDLGKYLTEHVDLPNQVQSQEDLVRTLERKLEIVRRAFEGVQVTSESLRTRIRPSVQGYMSAILPALTSSKYKAAILDEDYNLQVWDPEAGEYKPRDVYSGGAEDQFLLAMRLAFALALMPEAKGQKPEFVFLDEPLGSSDEIRRSGIVDYLVQDLSKKFKQIFIISHVGGLEEHVQNIIRLDDGMVVGGEV
ncbi:MAG TPA: AAA family ATPase [Candidatus Acidoferrum sp.]|nr:AAA family ATPase [Candidatus Acidoferrum sp.]